MRPAAQKDCGDHNFQATGLFDVFVLSCLKGLSISKGVREEGVNVTSQRRKKIEETTIFRRLAIDFLFIASCFIVCGGGVK